MENENWRPIKGFVGVYEISSFGKVRSLPRLVKSGKSKRLVKGRILRQRIHNGYFQIDLHSRGIKKTYFVHQLMAVAYLAHAPNRHNIVVDHKDNDRLNNRISNLQLITHRLNSSKDRKGGKSKYVGVSKVPKGFSARISIDGKRIFLGHYESELEAHKAYQNKLNEIQP